MFVSGVPRSDLTFQLSNGKSYQSYKTLVSINSEYFSNCLSDDFAQDDTVRVRDVPDRVFKVLLRFLELDLALIPDTFGQKEWLDLLQVAKYYSLDRLTSICEYQLSLMVPSDAFHSTLHFAVRHRLENLKNFCA